MSRAAEPGKDFDVIACRFLIFVMPGGQLSGDGSEPGLRHVCRKQERACALKKRQTFQLPTEQELAAQWQERSSAPEKTARMKAARQDGPHPRV